MIVSSKGQRGCAAQNSYCTPCSCEAFQAMFDQSLINTSCVETFRGSSKSTRKPHRIATIQKIAYGVTISSTKIRGWNVLGRGLFFYVMGILHLRPNSRKSAIAFKVIPFEFQNGTTTGAGNCKAQAKELKQSGNLQSSHPRHGPGDILHLAGQLIIHAPRRFVHRRADQILQHLLILAGENIRLDAHVHNLLLAIHLYGDHAAAGRRLHRHGVHLLLQVFLDLPQPREHLLQSVDFHIGLHLSACRNCAILAAELRHETFPETRHATRYESCHETLHESGGFTSEIFPPKRSSIERTIGWLSNRARNSAFPELCRGVVPLAAAPRREVLDDADAPAAAAAAILSILAQTRTGLPSTLLACARILSSASRPSSNSANAR